MDKIPSHLLNPRKVAAMFPTWRKSGLLLTFFASLGCQPTPSHDLKVVGGQEVPSGYDKSEYMGVVQLQYELKAGPEHEGAPRHCTGTKIGDRHILTASHCIDHADKTKPLEIRLAPGEPYVSFSWNEDLTLLQDPAWASDRMKRPDVAVITLDARKFGYDRLEKFDDLATSRVSRMDFGEWKKQMSNLGVTPRVMFLGYGCQESKTFAKLDANGNYNFSGQDTLRFGQAPVIEWPEEKCLKQYPGDANRCVMDAKLYLVTQGQKIVRQGDPLDFWDDTQRPDPNDREANSVCWGDSGGPVSLGWDVIAVVSGQHFDFYTDRVLNRHSIPDYDFVQAIQQSPIIDGIAIVPEVDPTQENSGRTLRVYPGIEGQNILYIKGYGLQIATFEFEDGTPLPVKNLEVLPQAEEDTYSLVRTVKLTLADDAPTKSSRIVARYRDQSSSGPRVASKSATLVTVIAEQSLSWARYKKYSILKCGESYAGVSGSCETTNGLSSVTMIRQEVFESEFQGSALRLERVEATHSIPFAFTLKGIDLDSPKDALGQGLASYSAFNCDPSGTNCATLYFDFRYADGEKVDKIGSECRYSKRRYYDIEVYVKLFDTRLPLTDLVQPIIEQFGQTFPVIADSFEFSPIKSCEHIEKDHPAAPPYSLSPNGELILEAGWSRVGS